MKYEITSYNTKKLLADTLISLMKKKDLSKISVTELVKECHINRKTFYYHFSDIYELLKWYLEQEATLFKNSLNTLYDFNEAINIFTYYINKNPYLYNCVNDAYFCDKLIDFIEKLMQPIVYESITHQEQFYTKNLDKDYKDFLSTMMAKIVALSIIDNIKHKNNYDIEKMHLYLSNTINASIEGFFSKI